jgi:transcriptional regulator with XRE-family HTH domain
MGNDSSQADATTQLLKSWRARERLSQAEAAAVLRVSVRTLQGWESGRPMPYPDVLQAALTRSKRSADPFLLAQSEFPRQFAGFVNFIGAADLDAPLRKVTRKLERLLPSTRFLYGDRYFFHEQFLRFTDGTPDGMAPFQLDISDPVAVRAAQLIADINRVKTSLSARAASRLRQMVIGGLKPGCDIRQLEHELRCATHFARRGFGVTHADLEGLGNFDLLIDGPSGPVEVECKTVAEDTGMPIKHEMIVQLFDVFVRSVSKSRCASVTESGVFSLLLSKRGDDCTNLVGRFRDALESGTFEGFGGNDFEIAFTPKPRWTELLKAGQVQQFISMRSLDPDFNAGNARSFTTVDGFAVGLSLQLHKPSELGSRSIDVIKRAADQCTGRNPALIWLHFVGAIEEDFLALVQLSSDGRGAGLNSIVASALHPDATPTGATPTDRSHVNAVKFSVTGSRIDKRPALAPNLLIVSAVTNSAPLYHVPNPLCRWPLKIDS